MTDDTWSSALRWLNAWRWIAFAPSGLYTRKPTPVSDLIDVLCRLHHSEWTQKVSDTWSQILHRARLESHSDCLALCVQALKFAFDNSNLPLGAVITEAFHEVYVAVTGSSTFPSEAEPLFGFFDWDKGKELRRNLIDTFLRSEWPPGDLVIAVADVRLLRKIFKRLMRKPNGEQYARTALADLEHRTDQSAVTLARALQDMLDNPDFYEAWD